MRLFAPLAIVLGVLPAVAPAGEDEVPRGPVRDAARRLLDWREHGVGDLVPDVEVRDLAGTPRRLSGLARGAANVIVMRDVGCPVAKRYGPRLATLEERFAGDDVTFLYLYVDEHEDAAAIRRALDGYGLGGRALRDADATLARTLGARSTTEAFVLDRARTLRYRGAVDDQHGIGFSRPEPTRAYLADALDAVLARRDVPVKATTAPGCLLDLEPIVPADDAPTYHEQISRVLDAHCVSCHRDGGVAPFALDDYASAEGRRAMIRYVVEHRVMPPWGAAPHGGPWLNDRSLPERDRRLLLDWIAQGCARGDPANAPVPREWPTAWQIGEPDAVYAIPDPVAVPAEGVVDYVYQWVQTDQQEDRWVRGFEIRPTAPGVVHHVLVFIEEPPDPRSGRRTGWQSGLSGYFAGYVPGEGARIFGDGLARRLPAGAWLKFQLHYTPDGTATEDVTRVGFLFADEPPEHEVVTGGVHELDLAIPPGAPNHREVATHRFRRAAVLSAFSPHMHLRGKAFRYELELPDGERELLLDVPAYDFNWQLMYQLAEPRIAPPGSRLVCTAWFDNSADNPANPDPSRTVRFGEQTFDEMLIGYFEWWRP